MRAASCRPRARHMYRQVSPKTRALYTTQHAIRTDRSAPGLCIQQAICTDRSAPRPGLCTQHNTPYVKTGQPQDQGSVHNTPYVQTGQPQGSGYNKSYVQTGQPQDHGAVHNTTRHMYRQVSPRVCIQHAICTDRSSPRPWDCIQHIICTDRKCISLSVTDRAFFLIAFHFPKPRNQSRVTQPSGGPAPILNWNLLAGCARRVLVSCETDL